MARQYADRIGVLTADVGGWPVAAEGRPPAAPHSFIWRRRRYRVRSVLQRWIEVGSWWRAGSADEEYEMWRVEAAAERPRGSPPGQFDLCRNSGTDQWFLVRAFD